jgi:hypothetical protein
MIMTYPSLRLELRVESRPAHDRMHATLPRFPGSVNSRVREARQAGRQLTDMRSTPYNGFEHKV